MNKVELDKLFLGINQAVTTANEQMRRQHTELIREFFDEQNKPIHVELTLPVVRGSEVSYNNVKVPKLTLVPLTMLKVKKIKLNLKLNRSQLGFHEIEDPGDTTSRVKKNKNLKKPEESLEDPFAHIEIVMEGSDPPEGILKINDFLIDQLP